MEKYSRRLPPSPRPRESSIKSAFEDPFLAPCLHIYEHTQVRLKMDRRSICPVLLPLTLPPLSLLL